MLFQTVYSSTSAAGISLAKKVSVAQHSVKVCRSLGITGRVFAMPDMAINVIEGPKDIVEKYNKAVEDDDMIGFFAIFYQSDIPERSFEDYSVWLSYKGGEDMDGVHLLNKESLAKASHVALSPKLQIMLESYMSMYLDLT